MKMNLGITVGVSAVAANVAFLLVAMSMSAKLDRVTDQVDQLTRDVKEIQDAVLVKTPVRIKLTAAEKDCLARNIFFEAGVESHAGKIAVAQVTLNRVKTKRWGDSVCEVVHAPSQFSWTRSQRNLRSTPKGELWDRSVAAVNDFKKGVRVEGLDSSLFYHTDYVDPFWKDPTKQLTQIGRHIFYSGARRKS